MDQHYHHCNQNIQSVGPIGTSVLTAVCMFTQQTTMTTMHPRLTRCNNPCSFETSMMSQNHLKVMNVLKMGHFRIFLKKRVLPAWLLLMWFTPYHFVSIARTSDPKVAGFSPIVVASDIIFWIRFRWPNMTYIIWLFNIAMENGPFIDGVPIKFGDFPWLC